MPTGIRLNTVKFNTVKSQRDPNEVQRAYSVLTIKSVGGDGEERVIEGIASSPQVDRVGDIVRSLGAKFSIPMPLLWQHRHSEPVGWVEFAQPNEEGIPFSARFAKVSESGRLKDRIDEAWQSVKYGLVRAVSIGFKILDFEPLDPNDPWGGWDIKKWEWLELSAVTIPANTDATITNIRSIVSKELAATGRKTDAGDTAPRKPVNARGKSMAKKTIAEQIAALEATRVAKAARMTELMEEAAEKGETLDEAQTEEYDGLESEIKGLDAHLKRLRTLEKMNVEQAKQIAGTTSEAASESRVSNGSNGSNGGGVRVTGMRSMTPPEMGLVRAFLANSAARLDGFNKSPAQIARERWPDNPEVEAYIMGKAAVSAGTSTHATWAGPLVYAENLASEFVEYLRPKTILGRIPGLRRVPFNIRVPRQTGGATVGWVGEGSPKPLSSLAFDSITLAYTKLAGIIAMTQELIRFSNPSVEAIVRDELARAIVQMMDRDFIDPTKAAVTGVSPASITNGVTPVTATGTSADAFRTDLGTLIATFLDNNLSMSGAVFVMNETQAMKISLMRTALDNPEFPGVTTQGGTLLGIPLVTSENLPDVGGSPANGSIIVLLKADEILLADDGGVDIALSTEASLQMDSAPDSPSTASTVLVSLFQNNMVAVRAERFVNWQKKRTTAVNYINYAKYVA